MSVPGAERKDRRTIVATRLSSVIRRIKVAAVGFMCVSWRGPDYKQEENSAKAFLPNKFFLNLKDM